MLLIQQASPGWGHFMDELERLLPSDQFKLRKYEPAKTLKEIVADAQVLILGTANINREILDAAPLLKMIHQHGRGVDSVDIPYATEKGVYVCNISGENATSVAEHAFFLILALAKKYKETEKSFKQQRLGTPPTQELRGKHLGLLAWEPLEGSSAELLGPSA